MKLYVTSVVAESDLADDKLVDERLSAALRSGTPHRSRELAMQHCNRAHVALWEADKLGHLVPELEWTAITLGDQSTATVWEANCPDTTAWFTVQEFEA